jgi:alpha-glucosidase (family GH31 glycosyl hydrolase)
MIRYYYTEMMIHSAVGGAFYKPLFFTFPDDAGAYTVSQNHNVMLGSRLKLSIQSTTLSKDGGDNTDFYFPAGVWCDVFNKKGTESCMTLTESTTITMSTKPYEFYLHIFQGSVVPMQDGKNLHRNFNVSNTAGLQQYPVDLHINPWCHEVETVQVCDGAGRYVNDDGETLSFDDSVNTYFFDYVQNLVDSPNNLTVNITQHTSASKYDNNVVNNNDGLNTIQIYNAAAQGLNANFTTEATMKDGTLMTLADAIYDAVSDRLVFTNDVETVANLWLPQINWITFTKAA